MEIELPRIEISEKRKKDIAKELTCTTQSVRNALRYQSNSEQAKKIRRLAKKILLKEAENISITVKY